MARKPSHLILPPGDFFKFSGYIPHPDIPPYVVETPPLTWDFQTSSGQRTTRLVRTRKLTHLKNTSLKHPRPRAPQAEINPASFANIRRHTSRHKQPQAATSSHKKPHHPSSDMHHPRQSSHRRPQAATGSHRQPQTATGSHRQPQAATGSHRQPQAATGSHRQPQAATSSHKQPQAAAAGSHKIVPTPPPSDLHDLRQKHCLQRGRSKTAAE